jgi:thiol-disulfide isomerase/thioredoxin
MKYIFTIAFLVSYGTVLSQIVNGDDSLNNKYFEEMKFLFIQSENSLLSKKDKGLYRYNIVKTFIEKHPSNNLSAEFIDWNDDLDSLQIDKMFGLLSPTIKKQFREAIRNKKLRLIIKTDIPFPHVTFRDSADHNYLISELKGKVVFVNIWASWCAPCRQETPILKNLYQSHRADNFEIVSISLDSSRNEWLEAVKKDGQSWIQLCDLINWQDNKLLKKFGIDRIPYNFLLNKNGIVVNKDIPAGKIENAILDVL